MKQKEAEELAESVGVLVEKILKLVLKNKYNTSDDEEKESNDEKGSPE